MNSVHVPGTLSYAYDVNTFFPNGLEIFGINNDVTNSSLGSNFDYSDSTEMSSAMTFIFYAELDSSDETILDNIVANYVYYPIVIQIYDSQTPITQIPDADTTITPQILYYSIWQVTPTIARTFTVPSDFVRQLANGQAGNSVNFTLTNLSTNTDITIAVQSDENRTNMAVGNMVIAGGTGANFQFTITNMTYEQETYVISFCS
jgi:hypothetical protein